MASISLKNLGKSFNGSDVVKDVDLDIAEGEFIVLVGPSGCGKSTTLRMLAGLESAGSGEISFDGTPVNDWTPKERNVAMVFQSYALYPHMTVEANMRFPLEQSKMPREDVAATVRGAAEMLNLTQLLGRKPKTLSGGQRQRVAMGRAIVRRPAVFLFDEPLSNLDAALRTQMRMEIRKLHDKLQTTTVYVTHDQVEAMTLADRVVVMDKGRVIQVGTPMEIYERPATRFVASFIGSPPMNFVPARLEAAGNSLVLWLHDSVRLPVPPAHVPRLLPWRNRGFQIGVRPEHLLQQGQGQGVVEFDTVLCAVEVTGSNTQALFAIGATQACAVWQADWSARPGQTRTLAMNFERLYIVDEASGLIDAPAA